MPQPKAEQLIPNSTDIFNVEFARVLGKDYFFIVHGPINFTLGFQCGSDDEANAVAKSVHDALNRSWKDPRLKEKEI